MSQKIPSDSSQKGFAVGRGLLAAAETLNFSMNEQCSDSLHHGSTSRQLHSMSSGMGGGEGDHDPQLSRRGGGHIGNSMKLFASLGLSPADLDVLAQIPEENISVESLPQLIMQLKNRKVDSDRRMAGNSRGDLSGLSSEPSYRASRDNWDDMRVGRLGGSMGQASALAQQGDLGYSSIQDTPAGRYELDYGHGSGGRDPGWYSDLSRDRYSGMGMGPPSAADSVFMTRRMGSPSQGKVQDFLGVIPHMFPHVCSLCDFDVHSTMEWNQHTDGLRHTENQRLLLQMYPEWDPHMATSRGGGSHLQETSNQSASLLGPIPMGGGQQAGGGRMSSGWGGGAGSNVGSGKPHQHSMALKQIRSKVVVAKYDRSPLSNKALFALAEPFGTLCEHLVLKNKAFLEMETHKEARDVVSYYQQNPAVLHGKQITLYLSKELMVIQKDRRTERINREAKQGKEPAAANQSQVVFFSNLPRENEKKQELLTIARRFGIVKKHLFLTEEAFVQLGSAEDAEMLVKYHTLNPLTIQGKCVRLNICTKYKTLNVNNRSNKLMDDKRRRRSSSTGPKDKSSSSKSTKSSSSSSSKVKEDRKEPPKGEDGGAGREGEGSGREGEGSGREGVGSGDVVAGVMEGDKAEEYEGEGDQGSHDVGPSADNAEAVTEDPETAANASLESQEEKEPAPDSDDIPSTAKGLSSSDVTEKAEGSEVEEGTVPGPEEKAEGELESEQMETEATTDEPETEVKVDSPSAEPAESSEMHEEQLPADQEEGSMEQDFPENMDDFVTLDELAEDEDLERHDSSSKEKYSSSGSSKKIGGLRVVNVVGFKRAYGFLNEILALAKPFGTVVQHLVLDVRPEAFLQLTSEEEAKAMVNFYSGNVTPTVCGKSVKIYHSQTYATIQSGRVVYVGQIPHFKSSDASLLKIAEPFGKVRRYFLNRSRNECFIEMERGEDAERMADTYKDTPPKLEGKRLTVYVSRKYKQLKYGHRPPAPDSEEKEKRSSKRERSGSETSSHRSSAAKSSAKQDEEPPVKKSREEMASSSTDEPDKEDEEKMVEAPTEQSEVEVRKEEGTQGEYGQPSENSAVHEIDTDMDIKIEENEAPISILSVRSVEENGETASTPSQAEGKLSSASLVPLGPYEPNNPVGVEYVKMGYYCRVCFLFYSNEETAKKVHCSSQSHYQKLKKHLEKEKAKAQSSTGMKTPV
ncbi:matrin-3 [Oncorhynchus tshawytscha]|uniref:Matrin-3-like n=1 Tax=Oncorhynchus tshawytscha TaxID=74940 RepID=A0A8C8LNP9_ONCTS|nr:matrin-3 [Oncorhynchus tshawytscha]XP_042159379.1 matrin-3 [Oncorhynchus tshawytscha]